MVRIAPTLVARLISLVIVICIAGAAMAQSTSIVPPQHVRGQHPPAATGSANSVASSINAGPVDPNKTAQLIDKAKAGDPSAASTLGEMYAEGKIRESYTPNQSLVMGWFRASATQKYLADHQGPQPDDRELAQWFQAGAKQGDAVAENYLGLLYLNGIGLDKDSSEAQSWFEKAADQGEPGAEFWLGDTYLGATDRIIGIDEDDKQAAQWFRKSADQGTAVAEDYLAWMYAIGRGVPQDMSQAQYWFQKSADQGCANAQYYMGLIFFGTKAGVNGVEEDDAQAVSWLKKSAAQGDSWAEGWLGTAYMLGWGVNVNYTLAFDWLRKSADQGQMGAEYRLGQMYEHGLGVKTDYFQARNWLQMSAAQGFQLAQTELQQLPKGAPPSGAPPSQQAAPKTTSGSGSSITTLSCKLHPDNAWYDERPTIVVLDEANGQVTAHFGATHMKHPGHTTGGADGRGGGAAGDIGPVQATFGENAITFESWTLDRTTGELTNTTGWWTRTCSPAKPKF